MTGALGLRGQRRLGCPGKARRRAGVVFAIALAACTNNPYPGADDDVAVRYRSLPSPPKTLDPAVSYSVLEHTITANLYESLLEYHYLERPYTMMPGLARELPEPQVFDDGRVSYTFRLREGMRFQDDPAFALAGKGHDTRAIEAGDVAFQLMRLADPAVGSPIVAALGRIEGLPEFGARLAERREDPRFASLPAHEQYAEAGGIAGVRVHGATTLEILLTQPNPQLLYWFAMPFTAPVPWEAVAYYDGNEGRPFFKDHPVSVGPFRVALYEKRRRIVLERNPNWYGALHPEWRAPGATYPESGDASDMAAGRLASDVVGRPLPFLDRIEFRIEKERIPEFNKFLQGYYDQSSVPQESFETMIQEGRLSEAMATRGVQLDKAVDLDIRYVGFNMDDPVVGAPAGERGRKLRQAMSLAIDASEFTRLFLNGRGISAQTPIPPGLFGYDPEYRNPYRQPDLDAARRRLGEAGFPDGIDPATGKPLRLSFDTGDTSTRGRLRYQFFVNSWARLGIDVEIAATNYNQFREKIDKGAYQIFTWGWVADYPDPENFLFLLYGPMGGTESGGPNSANFSDPEYDALFVEMRDLPNGPERAERIVEMRAILERERPWIELIHREKYALFHGWLRNVKTSGIVAPSAKYLRVDPDERALKRARWNRPVVWPAYGLAAIAIVLVTPGVMTFLRERQ
jgi:oligopeptide transport system substrate-binding protein